MPTRCVSANTDGKRVTAQTGISVATAQMSKMNWVRPGRSNRIQRPPFPVRLFHFDPAEIVASRARSVCKASLHGRARLRLCGDDGPKATKLVENGNLT